ncbi:MAG: glutamine--fructose-6-phosphate transaminase (isomerizing) [Bacteroidia bacterium]
MCGIVGYLGYRDAWSVLLEGLERLAYRGYDSAGVALISDGEVHIAKRAGKVQQLREANQNKMPRASIGIAHTRWATHGEPSDLNAHPHTSYDGRVILVHNGIIENFTWLRENLAQHGIFPESETDTEILAHWFAYHLNQSAAPVEESLQMALRYIEGAYGIALLLRDQPHKLIAIRRFSPMVVGLGEREYFLASDATPIVPYTRNVIYLHEDEMVIMSLEEGFRLLSTRGPYERHPQIDYIEWDLAAIEKGGYKHFMLKEIFEQPDSLRDCMRGRIRMEPLEVRLGGIQDVTEKILRAPRLTLIGCGTSWHAGLIGEYLIENLARIPTEVEYASEFRYRDPVISTEDVVIGISQSGETADTLAALKLAKAQGALILGITNVVGSSIPRETHAGIYIHAGPEIGVASTKAFTSQVLALTLMAIYLGQQNGKLDPSFRKALLSEILSLPEKVARVLENLEPTVQALAQEFAHAENFLYLGRGYNFPVALEGALKLKEISYIHAEGYPAAEMKHGPIALIDERMPTVIIATRDRVYDKILSNIQEIRARKGHVIAIATEGDTEIAKHAHTVLYVPSVLEPLSPIVNVLPLQLLAYHTATLRGCDVDKPRNLAKSVTVE